MKKIITLFILSILLCGIITSCKSKDEITAIRDRGELRVGIKADVPKFGYIDPATGKPEGMEVDLARLFAKDILGNENTVKFINVGSAQTRAALLENGGIDIAVATFTITEERKKTFNFSRPYFIDELGCLVRAGSGIQKIEDLNGKTAGVVRTSTAKAAFEKECTRLGIRVTLQEFPSYPEVKQALKNSKIDAFVSDKSILFGYSDKSHVLLNHGFNPQEYGAATKKENVKLIARIDTILDTLEKNGGLAAILKKWDLTP